MRTTIHRLAGSLALFCIASFWSATLASELLLGPAAVVAVKQGVLAAMWLLVPAMIVTGASGRLLAGERQHPLLAAKQKRMAVIAGNGLLILLPAAWLLCRWAEAGRFDALFYAVQVLELVAGAVNATLLVLNARDGLRLRRPAY